MAPSGQHAPLLARAEALGFPSPCSLHLGLQIDPGAAPFIDCMPPSTVPSLPESGNAPFPKFCFFFRRGPNVDASVASDTTLLYGEMSSANPLASVRGILGSAYADMFAASVEWGKAPREERVEVPTS